MFHTAMITQIRLLLYSQDSSLQCLLAPTLGSEFSVCSNGAWTG